ncbi:hypothetical protein [Corynebacterium bouchesdurhonense]|uniref:hypothetical protein n=1 Tax=Corynebacterium bouchesdurhonense TaxID=1720192 RepID=UPI000834E3B9|nr:hypothetical protein [Corynebacterium bouchesdurhonense]
MRNFQKAALAGATAVALTFGTTAVAIAEESAGSTNQETTASSQPAGEKESLSSKIGRELEKNKPADGENIFGSSKDFSNEPAWAKILYGTTITAGVAAFIGLIVGPLYNFVVHGPIKF